MAFRVCSTFGCGRLHEGTGKCPECRKTADHQRAKNRRRDEHFPYSTKGHQRFREAVLAKHPRCVCDGDCKRHDGLCAKPATVADHFPRERDEIIANGDDPNDPAYGRGLCASCHSGKTAHTRPAGFNWRE